MNFDCSTEDTQYFFSLTPTTVLDAIEELGVRCTGRCLALNSLENRVYEVEVESDESGSKEPWSPEFRVAKFYRPGRWTQEQILEEHQFLFDLERQEIPAVAPLLFPDGSSLKQLAEGGIWYTVFPRIGGRNLDELSPEQLEQLGKFVARLHNLGDAGAAPNRLTLSPAVYGRQNLEFLCSSGALPDDVRPSFEQLVNAICDSTESWFADYPLQRIHGDCHVGNILWRQEQCFLVDFDDMVNGPCVQDLWLITPGRDTTAAKQREHFLTGYQQMRPFELSSLRLIEPLRALRMIHFCAWIAKRWEDPAFPPMFPEFGSPKYWKEQLGALQEQLSIIQSGETW